MTIGEKITQRRLAAHLSQEILAEFDEVKNWKE